MESYWVNLFHLVLVAPMLAYIGWLNSTDQVLSQNMSYALMAIAAFVAVAHGVFILQKLKDD